MAMLAWALYWPGAVFALGFLTGAVVHLHPKKTDPATFFQQNRELRINSIRINVAWWDVETIKGTLNMHGAVVSMLDRAIDEAVSHGIEPQVILGYSNGFYDKGSFPVSKEAQDAFVRYAEFVVRHLKGRVRYYEVWTEWNIGLGTMHKLRSGYPDSASDYARLLKRTYQVVKAVDPAATFMVAAPGYREAEWTEKVILQAVGYFDAIAVHPYNWSEEEGKNTPEEAIAWLEKLYRDYTVQMGGKTVPLFVTELGWPMHRGKGGSDESRVAAYLARFYFLAAQRPYLAGVWWYDYRDDGDDPVIVEHNFGLVSYNYRPKPAWFALRDVAAVLRNATAVGYCALGEGVRCVSLIQKGGRMLFAIWRENSRAPTHICIPPGQTKGDIAVRAVGDARVSRTIRLVEGKEFCGISISERPILIGSRITPFDVQRRFGEAEIRQ